MIYILIVFIVCVCGGALLFKGIGNAIAPDDYNDYKPSKKEKDSPMIIHNHITENHLHISKEDLSDLIESKKTTSNTSES